MVGFLRCFACLVGVFFAGGYPGLHAGLPPEAPVPPAPSSEARRTAGNPQTSPFNRLLFPPAGSAPAGSAPAGSAPAGSAQPATTVQNDSTAADAFQTFLIRLPHVPLADPPSPPPPLPPVSPRPAVLSRPGARLRGQGTFLINPWEKSLSLALSGLVAGRAIDSSLEIGTDGLSPSVGAGYLTMRRQDSSLRLGQGSDQLLGGVTGIQLGLRHADGSGYGSGVYVLSSGLHSRLTAGMDGELRFPHLGTAGALVGAEGSWRLFSSSEPGRLAFYGHLGHVAHESGLDWNVSSGGRLTSWLNVSGSRSGSDGYASDQGLVSLTGRSRMLTFERYYIREHTSQTSIAAANLFLPIRGDLATLRYQLVSDSGDTRDSGQQLSGTYYYTAPRHTILIATGQLQPGRSPGWQLGAASPLPLGSRLELDIGAQPGRRIGVQKVHLQLPIGGETRVGFLYGPSTGFRSIGRTGLGFELTRSLDFSSNTTGSIDGQIEAAGGELPTGIGVTLDNRSRTTLDPSGHFRFQKVEAGIHELEVDLSHVPSEWSAADSRCTIVVVAGHPSRGIFNMRRTASIGGALILHGSIPAVDSSGNPTSARASSPPSFRDVVITLNGSQHTTTDEFGRYQFSNLAPGTYTVELSPDAVPDGFRTFGPAKWTLQIAAGTHVTDADFQVEARAPNILFAELG